MKVCIVTSVFPRSQDDLEVPWLREIVRRCRAEGVDVRVFAPSFRGLRSHVVDGIPVKRFRYCLAPWETLTHEEGAPNKIHKFHYKLITVLYILAGTLGLVRFHLRERFDVIHVHWPFPHTFFALAARWFVPAKLVLNFYGADLLLIRKYPFVKKYLARFIRAADRVVAISRFTAGQIREVAPADVAIIPYGAAVTVRASADTAVMQPPVILTVGRMIERKGFEYLLKAMPQVLAEVPDAKLYLVGDGPLRGSLERLSGELGIAGSTVFTGKAPNEELDRLFAGCSVFVLPSIVDHRGDTEGLGVVILEAMVYGRPVIASDVGGIGDVVENDKTGLLVPQKDPSALAGAVIRILHDPQLAARLGGSGLSSVRKTFDWNSITRALLSIYGATVPK